MKRSVLSILLLCIVLVGGPGDAAAAESADVVFYGGTAAGVMGAIQAHRSGLKAVLISPAEQLGGMTTGGLGATDFGSKTSVTGLAAEFYRRIYETYLDPSRWVHETRDEFIARHPDTVSEDLKMQWFFEPKVALEVLEKMLGETDVEVWKGVDLAEGGVVKSGSDIAGLKLSDGREIQAKIFVDTSYEGDLMAAAGVPYVTGRQTANSGRISTAFWSTAGKRSGRSAPSSFRETPLRDCFPWLKPGAPEPTARETTACRPTISACV